jgi:hypothetical protein
LSFSGDWQQFVPDDSIEIATNFVWSRTLRLRLAIGFAKKPDPQMFCRIAELTNVGNIFAGQFKRERLARRLNEPSLPSVDRNPGNGEMQFWART